MADISPDFANMAFEYSPLLHTEQHVLNITYPAIHLLPEGTSLHLEPPTDCSYREKPRLGTYHLSADNLSFFHCFPVKPLARYLPQSEDGLHLLTINMLAAIPGHSILECVSYINIHGEVQHSVCLKVTWSDQDQDEFDYELSDSELKRTFSLNVAHNAHPWLDLLFNLAYRCSDRAYLHVQEQLRIHSPSHASQQEALWADLWDTAPSISGHDLFMSHVQCQLENGSKVFLIDLDPENVAAHANQPIRILLLCGHSQQFVYALFRVMPDLACLQASCHTCNRPVLEPADMIALSNRLSRLEREAFCLGEADWVALDTPVMTTTCELKVSVHDVCQILHGMLGKFEVPPSATPTALSFARLPETQAVLGVLLQELRGAGDMLRATPSGLLRDLEVESRRALMWFLGSTDQNSTVFLPPGLLAFLSGWLLRTVNLLSGNRRVAAEVVEGLSLQLGAVQVDGRESKSVRICG
jgi:hypothetical protein